MLFPNVVTVFNLISEDDNTYNVTVIKDVMFVLDENTGRNKLGLANSDSVTVYCPYKSLSNGYCTKAEYDKLSDAEKLTHYHFGKGSFIMNGDESQYKTLTSVDINKLKNDTDNIFEITGLADYPFGNLPIIQVSAR